MLDKFIQSQSLKEELVQSASSFCRKITSFALLEDITELQGMCFSPNELVSMDETELVRICQLILSRSINYKYDLQEYEINDEAINLFSNQIDRFKSVINNTNISDKLSGKTDEKPNVILENTLVGNNSDQ